MTNPPTPLDAARVEQVVADVQFDHWDEDENHLGKCVLVTDLPQVLAALAPRPEPASEGVCEHEAEAMNLAHEVDNVRERLWRLAALAGWRPGNPADNDATAEHYVTTALATSDPALGERIAQAIEALPGPNGEGVATWKPDSRLGYLVAIEEAAAIARSFADTGSPSGEGVESESWSPVRCIRCNLGEAMHSAGAGDHPWTPPLPTPPAAPSGEEVEFVDALVFALVDGNCDLADRDPGQQVWDNARSDVELLLPLIAARLAARSTPSETASEGLAEKVLALLDSYNELDPEEGDEPGLWQCAPEDRWRFGRDLRELCLASAPSESSTDTARAATNGDADV